MPRRDAHDMTQIARQLLIVRLASSRRRGLTVNDLVDETGASEKTIRRDISALQQSGFPLEEIEEAYGRKRWRMAADEGLANVRLDASELLSIYVAVKKMESFAGTPLWEGVESAIRKIRSTVGESLIRYLDKVERAVGVSQTRSSDYSGHGPILDDLMMATEERRTTHITYQSQRSTEPLTYDVWPYHLKEFRGSFYLIAQSHQHDEIRTFKVDRISNVHVDNFPFPEPKSFDPERFFKNSFGIFSSDGPPITVRIRFESAVRRFVEEHQWGSCRRLEPQHDGSLLGVFVVTDLEEIESFVMSFGGQAIVLEPDELKSTVRTAAIRMAKAHSGEDDAAASISSSQALARSET
ncbi:helix-turn-helix transcriptional regulator [Stratiformator vulcanicus]|uniref:HTH domain protein n=1 Tax=Stratiformator vulcanicus TaxID=2527980 RepID=A0A517R123_9PLAN|nr:WYL domain-containing protein [Stratiformator vulcanicus]QDT37595.1 HTH domain protein [Stratiformator vulcanicus]